MLFCRALRHRNDFRKVREELEGVGRERVGFFSPAGSGAAGGCGGQRESGMKADGAPNSPSIRILASEPAAGLLRPAYVLLEDAATMQLVVVVRGTSGFRDAVTALTTKAATKAKERTRTEKTKKRSEEPESESEEEEVHEGLAAAAEALAAEVGPPLALALAAAAKGGPAGVWKVVLTGHSAGGGVAALLALRLREEARGIAAAAVTGADDDDAAAAVTAAEEALASATAIAFACPPLASLALARSLNPFVTTVLCGADVVPTLSEHSLDRLRAQALEIAREGRKKRQRREKKSKGPVSVSVSTTSSGKRNSLALSLSGFFPPLPWLLALGISFPPLPPFFPLASRGRGALVACLLLGALGLLAAAAAAVASRRRLLGSRGKEGAREQEAGKRQEEERARPPAGGFRSNVVPWPGVRKPQATREGSRGRRPPLSPAATMDTTTTKTAARAALFPPGRILHLVPSEVLLEASSAAAAAAAALALSETETEEKKKGRSHGGESESDESACRCGCGGEGPKEGRKEGKGDAATAPARSSGTVILAAVPHERYSAIRPHARMLRDHFLPAHLEALDAAAAAFVDASSAAAAAARAEEATPAATAAVFPI